MKLEPNMYVRTKKGIAKIIDRILEPDHYYFKMWVTDKFLEINDDTEYISEVDVLKASHNIIDLIEVGDYVNGHRIEEIDFDDEEIFTDSEYYCGVVEFCNIKSVITHEQMEQMAYKVGE